MTKTQTSIKWHPVMEKFRTVVDKRLNASDSIVEFGKNHGYINTGSTVLNLLIGGSRLPDGSFICPGWPRGRISEIYGRESSGKSTIALMALGQALMSNNGAGTGLYIDLEHAVDDNYAMKLGADFRPPELGGTGQAMRMAPHYAEEVEAIVNAACLQGVDIIVIDSVAGLQLKREVMRDLMNEDEKQQIAEVPRFMSNWMPKLQAIIATTGTHVMFLNQTRDKIGSFGKSEESKTSTTGGNALKFWASNRMFLKPKMSAKAKKFDPLTKSMVEIPIATDIEIKNTKNKVDAKQGHVGLITIRYGVGIDEMRTMMNVATAYDIVKITKNKMKQQIFTFSVGDKTIEEIGIEKFRTALNRHKELYTELNNLCVEKILQGFKSISDEELSGLAEDAIYTKTADDDEELNGGPPEDVDINNPGLMEEDVTVLDNAVDLTDL